MAFKGTVLPVGELIGRAKAEPEPDWRALYGHVGVRNRAADAAAYCEQLIAEGKPLGECWRFGIVQTVDYYESTVRRGGIELGRHVFDAEPPRTGSDAVDAAFAALAVYLADRDGWTPPAWALDSSRRAARPWYPAQSHAPYFIAEANRETPPAFRERGVFISAHALDRA